jgi:iron complex transport system permease protein
LFKKDKTLKGGRIIALLLLVNILLFAFAAGRGTSSLGFIDVFRIFISKIPFFKGIDQPEAYNVIVFQIRLPRIFLAAIVGMALSMAGVTYQCLFKNPMADPYILGVSSGAGLGATIAMLLGASIPLVNSVPFMALIGAMASLFFVYFVSRKESFLDTSTLLLSGIAVSSSLSAITSLLMITSTSDFRRVFFWLLGGFATSSWQDVTFILPYILAGLMALYFFAREMNALLLGEEPAANLGIEVEKIKFLLLFIASSMTALAVCVSGTIGFVGLIIPHITRLIVGPDHRVLLPASALMGSAFLVFSDTIARLSGLPVGVITALAGGPFFIYLLKRKKNML